MAWYYKMLSQDWDFNNSMYIMYMYNKALFLYYFRTTRLKYIKSLRWGFGTNIPQDIQRNMSENESKWFETYNKLLFTYMKNATEDGMDLCQDQDPPKFRFITVCNTCFVEYILQEERFFWIKIMIILMMTNLSNLKMISRFFFNLCKIWMPVKMAARSLSLSLMEVTMLYSMNAFS